MKQAKNTVTLFLMISSVVLLIALQFFWLKSSYEKAFFDFRRESSILFRATVFNLRDSLFVKNIEPVKADSAEYFKAKDLRSDSFNIKLRTADTLKFGQKMEIFISSTETLDSNVNFFKPLASSINKLDRRRNFIIRMGPDTLSLDTLTKQYRETLGQSGILIPFHVQHTFIQGPTAKLSRRLGMLDEFNSQVEFEKPKPYEDTLVTDRVNLNPIHTYTAVFPGIRTSILKEITAQILFSAFLTFVIVTSFVITYRSLRSQQRLNDLKNDFINNVTHELKTPIATVSVALEALKDFHALDNPERTQEYLSIAQNELNRLTLMTDKILKASAFETQGVSFTPQKIDLNTLIKQVLSSMKLVFEKSKHVVNYTPEGKDFELNGSELHLTNVIYNLLDNALKYDRANSIIELKLKNSESQLEFSIRDQGIGIAKEYQKKIFEKFFRVPTGDVHNVKGYGLGLNYVASVVKRHGGKIDVESEVGKGSLFIIRLPK
jgi:two-component system phosphate regulon sensor histidine kinase PhoR